MPSIEHELLHAALLCGLSPDSQSASRLQIFLVANRDLGSRRHESDFQRSIQTARANGLFTNPTGGDYTLTALGLSEALRVIGPTPAAYAPQSSAKFNYSMLGTVVGMSVVIRGTADRSIVTLDGEKIPATEACRRLEVRTGLSLPTVRTSAVRVLRDLGIDRGFEIDIS